MRFLALTLALAACAPVARSQGPAETKYDPQIVAVLLDLLKSQDTTRPAPSDFTDTSLKDLVVLGTPEGYYLRTRYLNLGVPLAQSFAAAEDKRLKDQLVEAARWERGPGIRAVALIALAAKQEPAARKVLEEALNNPKAEIRFAALEALQIWGRPEAKALYVRTIRSDPAPIVRIYAAQALARLGDPLGLETLRAEIDSGSWLATAMAARYLGDLGTGDDYELVLDRMTREQRNDFVKAETAIAALKLFPRRKP